MNKKYNDLEYIEIAKIINTHGIKGYVKVNAYTEDLYDIRKYENLYLLKNNMLEQVEIEKLTTLNGYVLIKFKNIENIYEAEKLKNISIYVSKEERNIKNPIEDNDEYYISDLIGIDVYENEKLIGKLIDVIESSTDIYVIERLDKNKKNNILIPAHKNFIENINIEKKEMHVKLRGLDEI